MNKIERKIKDNTFPKNQDINKHTKTNAIIITTIIKELLFKKN